MDKLTDAQKALLEDVSRGNKNVDPGYNPAQKLVHLGLCAGNKGRLGGYWLELTEAGRRALAEGEPK